MFAGPEDESNHLQLVVPEVFRPEVLESLHEGIAGGHLGHEKPSIVSRKDFIGQGTGTLQRIGVSPVKIVQLANHQLTQEKLL